MFRWRTLLGVLAAVLAVFVVAVVVGNRSGAATPVADVAPEFTVSEQLFYNSVIASTDLESRPMREVVKAGHDICANIGVQGVDRLRLLTMIQTAKWGVNSAALLVAAEKELCPGRRYALVPVTPTSVPTTAAVPEGPAKVINTDATYEVGVEIAAGKWKASGGSSSCYWARLKADAEREIIDNEVGVQGDTVWVKAGELFKVQRCGTWTWVADK